MKTFRQILAGLMLALAVAAPVEALAQSDASRLDELERRVARAEHRSVDRSAMAFAAFVCAAFCALWAQQTGRNATLWFLLGALFTVFTLLVLLRKNSDDKKATERTMRDKAKERDTPKVQS